MIYAVISDVHANEEALLRVLDDAAEQGADKVVCIGDVTGYGPSPVRTLALVRERCETVLAGNHDDAVSGRMSAEGFIDLAGEAVARHRRELSSADIRYLKSLPYVFKGDGFIAAHGDFTEPEKFFYVEDEEDARVKFGSSGAQLMFVGHTHVPGLFLTGGSGRVYATEAQDFTLEEGKRYIVNPGSVGYPRERGGKCLSSYVLYDSTEKTVVFRYLPFSVSTVLQRGTPRRWPRLAFLGALVAAVAAAVAALLFARFQTPGAVAPPDAGLLVESVELDVSTARKASANLKLERSSCPLQLSVVFKSEDGGRLGEERLTVRRSSMKRFNVPEGARKAVFELRKNGIDDKPAVLSFRPSAVR